MARLLCDIPLGFFVFCFGVFWGFWARCVIPRLGFQNLPIPCSQVGQLCLSIASSKTLYFGNMSPTEEVNVIMILMVKNCQYKAQLFEN